MKTVELAFRIIKKQKIMNWILCMELAATLFFLSLLINRYEYNYRLVNLVDRANVSKSINYLGKLPQLYEDKENGSQILYNNKEQSELKRYLKSVPEFEGVSSIRDEIIMNKEQEEYNQFTTYDKLTAQRFRTALSKGVWFTDASCEDGRIPVVVVDTGKNGYKIGDCISGNLGKAGEDYEMQPEDDTIYQFEVVGIVDKKQANVFQPQGQRNYVAGFQSFYPEIYLDTVLFLCEEFATRDEVQESSNCIIYLKESTTEERVREIQREISKFGYCNRISDMRDQTIQLLNKKIQSDFPDFFSILCISCIGMISISILNTRRQRKDFAIYQLCGCSKRKTVVIYLVYFMQIFVVAFLLYLGVMMYQYITDERGISYLFRLSPHVVSCSITICIITCLCATSIPFVVTRNISVIRNYHLD